MRLARHLVPSPDDETGTIELTVKGQGAAKLGSAGAAPETPHYYIVSMTTDHSDVPMAPRLNLDLADGSTSHVYLGFGMATAVSHLFVLPQPIARARLRLALWKTDRTLRQAQLRKLGRRERLLRNLIATAKLVTNRSARQRVAAALGLQSGASVIQAFREVTKFLARRGAGGMPANRSQGSSMPPDYWYREYQILMDRAMAPLRQEDAKARCLESHCLLVEPEAELTTYAKALIGRAIEDCDPDILYGDSVSCTGMPDRHEDVAVESRFPFSPEYFSSLPDLGGVIAVRRTLLRSSGIGEDHGSALAAIAGWSSAGSTVCYLPAILSERALATAKGATGTSPASRPTPTGMAGDTSETPMTVVIPTKNAHQHLKACLSSLGAFAQSDALQVIVVQNNTDDPDALAFLDSLPPHITRLRYRGDFNYAAIMNFGSRAAGRKPFLVHLNDDTQLLERDSLTRLCRRAAVSGVAAVGPMLLFANGLIQHAGIEIGRDGTCSMIAILEPSIVNGSANSGYRQAFTAVREVSALTGACIAMRREVFEELGGYDEKLAVTYNDIDLCLMMRAKGYRVIYDGTVRIRHHASVSRGRTLVDPYPLEAKHFKSKHADHLSGKDIFSPGLGRLAGSHLALDTPFDAAQTSLHAKPVCFQSGHIKNG